MVNGILLKLPARISTAQHLQTLLLHFRGQPPVGMKRILQALLLATGATLLSLVNAQSLVPSTPTAAGGDASFSEGIEYIRLSAPQATAHADKIEIVELFWYGCPHCYQFEPALHEWTAALPADVEFTRMPAILSPRWELLARGYYAAELLGVLDKVHMPLFKAIHDQKQRIMDEDSLVKFVVKQGIDEKEFREAFKSFGVAAKINRARQMTQRYGINGVPSLVINGKYRTSASEAGSHEKMVQVSNYLIAKERSAASAAAPRAPANISAQ